MILSTSNTRSEIEDCLKNGADHYFVKPNNYDGLINIIKKLCNGHLTIATGETFPQAQKHL